MWERDPNAFAYRYRLAQGVLARLRSTGEHLVARQDGGSDRGGNIVAACQFCNSTRHRAKHPLDADRYREHVKRRLWGGSWHPPEIRVLASLQSA